MGKKLIDLNPGKGKGVSSVTWDEYWARSNEIVYAPVADIRVIKMTDFPLLDAISAKSTVPDE